MMVAKTDDVPDPIGQRPHKHDRKFYVSMLHLPVIGLLPSAGIAILMLLAVLGGWPGFLENLEQMGVHIGPTHL